MTLTSYPGTVRQLTVTGLGRDDPTVIITNDTHDDHPRPDHPVRPPDDHRAAAGRAHRAFCADALSSTVNLNVDLDVMLAVLAQALTAALRARLPGYATVTPDTIQRRFLETPGQIITIPDTVTVRLERRAFSPVLRKADLPPATPVPWWGAVLSATSSPERCPEPPAWEIRAKELAVRESMVFLGRPGVHGRSARVGALSSEGPLMLVDLTDVRGERAVLIQVNWIG